MAAIGNATKHGFLVREGDALERLAKVSTVTFDKTGTLTTGILRVANVNSFGELAERDIYSLAAAAERMSEHPLGRAVVRCHQNDVGGELPLADGFKMIPGEGIIASVEGRETLAGNQRLLDEYSVELTKTQLAAAEIRRGEGETVIYVALDRKPVGFISLSDTIRPESAAMISSLSDCGVTPVLLTGDNPIAAANIAGQLGINEVHAGCLPEDKLGYISGYQQDGKSVCMIGDGINDAPALKNANVGIAMGGVGSDIAVEADDIALVDDEIKELPHLIRLSKRMMTTIKLNLTFSMLLNFLAIGLAIPGILNPVVGALVHNAGSVLVISNSALLLGYKYIAKSK